MIVSSSHKINAAKSYPLCIFNQANEHASQPQGNGSRPLMSKRMAKISGAVTTAALVLSISQASGHAQSAPASPDKVWHSKAEQGLERDLASLPEAKYNVDPRKN